MVVYINSGGALLDINNSYLCIREGFDKKNATSPITCIIHFHTECQLQCCDAS